MSQQSKRELVEAIRERYLKASKSEKSKIIDEFVATTSYHRKHAIRLLKRGASNRKGKPRGRKVTYQGEVVKVLEQIWEICGRICSRRLHPHLPEMVKVLERHGELLLRSEVKAQLLQMSRATIDRCLQPARFEQPRGLSTTKPGGLLKHSIPVRTFADWDDAQPGFIEADLVAHCGQWTVSEYLDVHRHLNRLDGVFGMVTPQPGTGPSGPAGFAAAFALPVAGNGLGQWHRIHQ